MKNTGHRDVTFVVPSPTQDMLHKTIDAAAATAFLFATAHGAATIDVVVSSEAGAEWFGGDDAVAEYNEDRDASVFRRFEVKVNDLGRVP